MKLKLRLIFFLFFNWSNRQELAQNSSNSNVFGDNAFYIFEVNDTIIHWLWTGGRS